MAPGKFAPRWPSVKIPRLPFPQRREVMLEGVGDDQSGALGSWRFGAVEGLHGQLHVFYRLVQR